MWIPASVGKRRRPTAHPSEHRGTGGSPHADLGTVDHVTALHGKLPPRLIAGIGKITKQPRVPAVDKLRSGSRLVDVDRGCVGVDDVVAISS